jgi:uncharacterized protein
LSAIFITGAGTGLGQALALEYAKEYETVVLAGRTESKLQQTAHLLQKQEKKTYVYPLDIKDWHAVHQAADRLSGKFSVEAIINNAGYGAFGPLETLKEEDIHQMIDTNVKGTIFVTQAFLPYFKKQQKGTILNIVSTAGLRGKVNESVYVASKFAVRGFTESLIEELEGTNIHVKAAYMGGMDTPFWDGNNHIKDKSRLRSPKVVAEQIKRLDDGRNKIIIES